MRVSVAVALPARQEVIELDLPEGSDVRAALEAARVRERYPELEVDRCDVGVWSRLCVRETPLREGDRVEIYRPLAADAKALRRERARLKPARKDRGAR
ncbi:MAG TPA: RnfH family protein [Usitatibacter sp.]|nr:RnfH family protein [Usitatibacter sp.]